MPHRRWTPAPRGRPRHGQDDARQGARGGERARATEDPDELRRDLHLRSSLRRGRWTAIERPRLSGDCASVTVCFPSGSGGSSSSAAAAFEIAISVAASIVQAWTGRGLEVELFTGAPRAHSSGRLDHERRALCTSQNPLHHLHALTELELGSPPTSDRVPRGPGLRGTSLGAQVIPVHSLLHRPKCTGQKCGVQITVWTDSHGRSLAQVSGASGSTARRERPSRGVLA